MKRNAGKRRTAERKARQRKIFNLWAPRLAKELGVSVKNLHELVSEVRQGWQVFMNSLDAYRRDLEYKEQVDSILNI